MSSIPQQTLRSRLDEDYPPAWIPEKPGDFIEGEFVRMSMGPKGVGKSGQPTPIATILTDDGPRSVWCWHKALREQLKEAQPRQGEKILVLYLGKKEKKSEPGKEYDNYRTVIDRPEPEFDWSKVEPDESIGDSEALTLPPAVARTDEDTPAVARTDEDAPARGDDDIPF